MNSILNDYKELCRSLKETKYDITSFLFLYVLLSGRNRGQSFLSFFLPDSDPGVLTPGPYGSKDPIQIINSHGIRRN